jgi:transcriptional regulator with XRE-family HTH domain
MFLFTKYFINFNEVENMPLGSSIKKFRKDKNLTLAGLSRISGISAPQLSKLENDKGNLSTESFRKLADALNVPLSFLMMTQDIPHIQPVREGDGFQMNRLSSDRNGVKERYLTIHRSAKMQPMVMTFPPDSNSGKALAHAGDEFFYVVDGSVRFFYGGGITCEMERGDFIYYDCSIAHRWENLSAENEAVILLCNTPPVI